jgi:hypothetical protein
VSVRFLTVKQTTALLTWRGVRLGSYEAIGPDGSRWFVTQTGSHRWSLYRDGSDEGDFHTLSDAKFHAGCEVREDTDPEYAASQRRIRARRRARRQS